MLILRISRTGLDYRYPWVPFSVTFLNETGDIMKSNDAGKKLRYELCDRESKTTLASGEITSGDELEMLLPDSRSLEITVDGCVYESEMKG